MKFWSIASHPSRKWSSPFQVPGLNLSNDMSSHLDGLQTTTPQYSSLSSQQTGDGTQPLIMEDVKFELRNQRKLRGTSFLSGDDENTITGEPMSKLR